MITPSRATAAMAPALNSVLTPEPELGLPRGVPVVTKLLVEPILPVVATKTARSLDLYITLISVPMTVMGLSGNGVMVTVMEGETLDRPV